MTSPFILNLCTMAGIYFHIPFCKQACHYCDFHFSTSLTHQDDMIAAMRDELVLRKEYLLQRPIETIYFGGGTPSILSTVHLESLFQTLNKHYPISPGAEITLEANPDDLTREKLEYWKKLGINRLSIGVQTFPDSLLMQLNRAHQAYQAIDAIGLARDSGFRNVSLDLIYALPGSTTAHLETDIQQALELAPQHISIYGLTIEEKTAFGQWFRKGKLKTVSEKEEVSQFELLMDQLPRAGYEQYEISNFAKEGFQARHNSNYWKGEWYLGIGPSAHSFQETSRQFNIPNNAQYVASLKEGKIPATVEQLSSTNQINEYLFTRLRTKWGIDLSELKSLWGYDLAFEQSESLNLYLKDSYLHQQGSIITLTRKGKLVADEIASDFFRVEMDS
jgi:oxygen-independent coproporphyrinogen III oxidase